MNAHCGREHPLEQIADFQKIPTLLFPDEQTIREYAAIKAELIASGKTIPENDVWIAGLARQHKLPVDTRDRHFRHIKDLALCTLVTEP